MEKVNWLRYKCPKCGGKYGEWRGDGFHCDFCYTYYSHGMTDGWEVIKSEPEKPFIWQFGKILNEKM